MKTKSITKLTVFALATAVLALGSCQKEKTLPIQTGNDLGANTGVFSTSQTVIKALQSTNDNSFKNQESLLGSCASATNDTTSKPHVYTVDYGTGCVGTDGITRSGKIIVTYNSTDMRLVNNQYKTTYSNYFEDNEQTTGSITLKNNGFNGNGNLAYTYTLAFNNVVNGATINQVAATLGYEWVAGEGTTTTSDDNFSLTGVVNCKDNTNTLYKGTISSPLVSSQACSNQYISGVITYVGMGRPNRKFDYGNGSCTGTVTTTIGTTSTVYQQGSGNNAGPIL